jgi:hypothetical protein
MSKDVYARRELAIATAQVKVALHLTNEFGTKRGVYIPAQEIDDIAWQIVRDVMDTLELGEGDG